MDVEATPARTYDEVAAARTMIQRTEERMGLKPQRLAAFGTGKFLGCLVGAGITPQIPAPSLRLHFGVTVTEKLQQNHSNSDYMP